MNKEMETGIEVARRVLVFDRSCKRAEGYGICTRG